MRSIRKKITVCLMATVLIALVLVGTSSITLNYRSTIATVDEMIAWPLVDGRNAVCINTKNFVSLPNQ